MCVIAVCEKGLSLDKGKFHACFSSNSHGAGFAWIRKEKLAWHKGFMKADEAWDFYQTISGNAHVAHFRLSSAGGISPELTHPFIVSSGSPIEMEGASKGRLLFHNGTISGWKDMLFSLALHHGSIPEGEMSDTRVMAMAVSTLGDKILDSGKYVIASSKEFMMYGSWVEHENIHYTNASYETRTYERYRENYNVGTYGKKPIVQTEIPFQLRGSGFVNREFKTPAWEDDEDKILTDKLLNSYYGRS